jgi:hypothetical protein
MFKKAEEKEYKNNLFIENMKSIEQTNNDLKQEVKSLTTKVSLSETSYNNLLEEKTTVISLVNF